MAVVLLTNPGPVYTSCQDRPLGRYLVDQRFRSMLDSILHGNSRPGVGYTLAVDAQLDGLRMQGVEMHELVHQDLSDNSCFGAFQQMLLAAQSRSRGQVRHRLDAVITDTMRICVKTQEGAATVRELAWIMSHLDRDAADAYIRALPLPYIEALGLYYPYFGDPRDTQYLKLPPPVYHTTLISLAIAAMNSPVIRDFTDPSSILDAGPIDLLPYSPDERLLQLIDGLQLTQDCFVETAISNLRAFDLFTASTVLPKYLPDAIDRMVNGLRARFPDLEWVDNAEKYDQIYAFRQAWRQHLEGTRWRPNDGPRGTTLVDISGEAALAAAFERLNAGPHEGHDLYVQEVDWSQFIRAHTVVRENMFRLIIVATNPQVVSVELIPYCTVRLQSIPMWFGAVSSGSPVVLFERSLITSCSMEDFVRDSASPWPMPTFFYSDVSRIDAIASSYPAWHPYTIRKCPSPSVLIGVLDEIASPHPRYWRRSIDGIEVFTTWSDHTVAFCLAMPSQIEPLQAELADLDASARQDALEVVAESSIPIEAVARAAYWAFVGR